MFSATFPDPVQEIAHKYLLDKFVLLYIGDSMVGANDCITQCIEEVPGNFKKTRLLELLNVDLERYEVTDENIYKMKTLVFVQQKRQVDQLALILIGVGIKTMTIHGDRLQYQREEALDAFIHGDCPVLIASAVAARGLDITGVDHVINYDLPQCDSGSLTEYVHRIGRTGRVGNPGRATSFYEENRDQPLAEGLVGILAHSGQVVPDFLQMAAGLSVGVEFGGVLPAARKVVEENWEAPVASKAIQMMKKSVIEEDEW